MFGVQGEDVLGSYGVPGLIWAVSSVVRACTFVLAEDLLHGSGVHMWQTVTTDTTYASSLYAA
jgi:hypothetical protein